MEKNNVSLVQLKDKKPRWFWTQFALPEPIVLVTTVDKEGRENAAPKSWIMPCGSSDLPMLAFGCDMSHDTAKNIMETKEFVVNIPSIDIIRQVMVCDEPLPRGKSEIKKAGLTSIPSEKVNPPRIKECKAHAECKLEWYKVFDSSVMFVGKIVAASVDEDISNADCATRQAKMKIMICWPDGLTTITSARNR